MCCKLVSGSTFNCPSCSREHQSAISTFCKPSSIVEKMMNEMIVTCDKCNNSVKLECIEKECKYLQDNQNRNLIDVIGQPLA